MDGSAIIERRGRKCCVCGRGFTAAEWEDRHWVHEEDCAWEGDHAHGLWCTCDLTAHAKHCPVCEPDKAQQFGIRELIKWIKKEEAKDG